MGDAFECAAKRASKKGTQGNFTGFARIVATSAAGNMVERAGGQALHALGDQEFGSSAKKQEKGLCPFSIRTPHRWIRIESTSPRGSMPPGCGPE